MCIINTIVINTLYSIDAASWISDCYLSMCTCGYVFRNDQVDGRLEMGREIG